MGVSFTTTNTATKGSIDVEVRHLHCSELGAFSTVRFLIADGMGEVTLYPEDPLALAADLERAAAELRCWRRRDADTEAA